MNKIETLIKELCPNGVEWKELGNICTVKTGKGINKNFIQANPGEFPVVNSGKDPLGFVNIFNTVDDPIGITSRGAGVGYVSWNEGNYFRGNLNYSATIKDKSKLSARFLYFYLKNNSVEIEKLCTFNGIPALNKENLEKLTIPIPPLEIQEEIVKILDKFTDYVTELTTELTLRKKQFEKYKEVLIGFEDKDIKLVKLLEIAEYGKKRIDNSEIEEGNYIGVENLLKNKEGIELKKIKLPSGTSIAFFPENILIGNIRPYLKKIYYSDFVGGTNGDVLVIQINEEKKHEVNPRFLYYCLSTDYFFHYMNQNSKGAKMPRGDKSKVMLFEIPLPSINKQSEIVAILDKFYNLTYNVSSGLPKEIELRKKQYEYYRDKLLSFD